jgi:hypothetical protein
MKYELEKEPFETYSEFDDKFESAFEAEGPDNIQESEMEALNEELAALEWEARFAQTQPTARRRNVQRIVNQQRAAMTGLGQAVQRMRPFIRKERDRIRFTLPVSTIEQAASKLRLEPAVVSSLIKSLKHTNQRLARGMPKRSELEMESGFYSSILGETSASCAGVTRVTTHWWGMRVWLNECHTQALQGAIWAGTGVGTICAAVAAAAAETVVTIPVALICGVVAGAGAIGAGAIQAIDGLGSNRGIVITKTWIGDPIIWHQ